MRLLPHLDLASLAARPKALVGFSDITALHLAWQRVGLVSYHGPVARGALTPFSRASLERAVVMQQPSAGHAPGARPLVGGSATGRLAGGNLALLAALCGTPWAPAFRGAVVVLEDVNEPVYRVERMLLQLRLAGAFDGCAGLVFGQFTDGPAEPADATRSLEEVAAELGHDLGVPTLLGVPVGHIEEQWTVPFGIAATLDADACTLDIHP